MKGRARSKFKKACLAVDVPMEDIKYLVSRIPAYVQRNKAHSILIAGFAWGDDRMTYEEVEAIYNRLRRWGTGYEY